MPPFRSIGLRSWATPLTIGSFLLMAVTGVLMFFDIVPGYVSFAHEWASWLFLLGVVAHVAVNLRPFQRHLQPRGGRSASRPSPSSFWPRRFPSAGSPRRS